MILVDSNLLLRYANGLDPLHPVTIQAIARLRTKNETLVIVPQNLYEFWTAGTRPPTANGLGLSIPVCERWLRTFRKLFPLVPDNALIMPEWSSLVVQHQCKGKVAHDARLVAAMNVHGIGSILTFNTADFQRYPHIAVLDPRTIASQVP